MTGELLVRGRWHSEIAHPIQRSTLVEHAKNTLFTPDRRHRSDPDVDLAAVDLHGNLSVLGATSLHDVHAGHDLETTDQSWRHRHGKLDRVGERAIDSKTNPKTL